MKKQERAALVSQLLDQYIPSPRPSLNFSTPYTLLIAALLSAQCHDQRVNLVTPSLFSLADTPEKMIRLSIDEIHLLIFSCGLSKTKATAIHRLSHLLLERYGGQVPECLEGLEELPGVGHKTASVVLSLGFHRPAFPVDTHIQRSARRWKLSDQKNIRWIERELKELFLPSQWGKIHLQIIHYARRYCPARHHLREQCPICLALNQRRY